MKKHTRNPLTEFEARAHGAPPIFVLLLNLGQALAARLAGRGDRLG